jgi:HD-like signal output (HDOD) protein
VRKRRLLVVDDEQAVLDGLRSVLRAQRREWEVTFALGGPAGLEAVRKASFDVVITDMRMPILNGADLLKQVKALQPGAVRLVLSGQTDSETAIKTALTAHQFLSKPCDIEILRNVVRRACRLNELLASPELRALVGDVSSLPVAPRSYLAISEALADPQSSFSDVARIVEREPALCAKVLQLVNSAFFGLPRVVSSIVQATNYLGSLSLKNLTLAMEAISTAHGLCAMSNAQFVAYQTNSILVGLLGRHWYVGDRLNADNAFAAGVMRDMGHLVLTRSGRQADVSERASHPAVSAYLLGLWGIPHAIIEAVAFHECPSALGHESLELADVVHLADRVASTLCPSPFLVEQEPVDLQRLAARGVSQERIDVWRQAAERLAVEAREMISA